MAQIFTNAFGRAQALQRQSDAQAQQNRLNELLEPYKLQAEQGQQQDAMRKRATDEAIMFNAALGADFDPTQNPEMWEQARMQLAQAGGDVSGISETYNPQQHQAIAGLANQQTAGSDTIQSTYLDDQGNRWALFRSGRKEMLGKSKMTPEEQIQFAFDKKYQEEKGKQRAVTEGVFKIELEKQFGKDAAERYSEISENALAASQMVPKLALLRGQVENANTGKWAEFNNSLKAWTGFGEVASHEELNAKLLGLAADILNQQTGTKTDFDFLVAAAQTASVDKSPQANIALIDALLQTQGRAQALDEQARNALDSGNPRALLDMRYKPTADEQAAIEALSKPQPAAQQKTPKQRLEELKARQGG